MRTWKVTLAAVLVAAVPATAFADQYSLLGFDAESVAQGGALTAGASGAAGVFYNPAVINKNKRQEQGVSYIWAKPFLEIDRVENQDVGDYLGADANRTQSSGKYNIIRYKSNLNDFQEERAERAPLVRGFNVGMVLPLAKKPEDAIASLGIGAFVPQGPIIRQRVNTPETPYFVEFDDRTQRLAANVAVGVDITDDIHVGAGASMLLDIQASSTIFVPLEIDITKFLENENPVNVSVSPYATAELPPVISPIAGAQWDINDMISVGATYRHEVMAKLDAEASLSVATGVRSPVNLPINFESSAAFTPSQAALGVQVRPNEKLRISADATWSQWSKYRPAVAQFSVSNVRNLAEAVIESSNIDELPVLGETFCIGENGGDPCIEVPTKEDLLGLVPTTISQEYEFEGFRDTISPRVGVAYDATDEVTVMGGYFYRPSIIDEGGVRMYQKTTFKGVNNNPDDGSSQHDISRVEIDDNTLDNDQHGFTLGVSYKYDILTFTLTGMYVHLVEETVNKPSDLTSDLNYDQQSVINAAKGGIAEELNMSFGYPGYTYGGYLAGGMAQVSLAF